MKRGLKTGVLIGLAVLVPGIAFAGVSLGAIMGRWNHERRVVESMLSGNRPWDQATIEAAVRVYVGDASMAADHINGSSAEARDFAARFRRLAQDAQAAGAGSGSAASFRPGFQRIMENCQSCHAQYLN